MVKEAQKDWRRFGCAAATGAAIALPAGVFIGSHITKPDDVGLAKTRPSAPAQPVLNRYSPKIRSDPYVVQQHRRIVEALEEICRREKLHCDKASAARRSISETPPS